MAKSKLDIEIEKIWNRLKDDPERGIIKLEMEYSDPDAKPPKAPIKKYSPGLDKFTEMALTKIKAWPNDNWPTQISKLKKEYGIGPEVSFRSQANKKYDSRHIGPKQYWWQNPKSHLSKDNKYYIVPLIFKNMNQNINLIDYMGPDGKYKIGSPQEKNTLLSDLEFTGLCKKLALKKIKRDLDKAMSDKQIEDWYSQYGIIPADANVSREKNIETKQPNMVAITKSWHIVPRKPDYQNLWIKVLFDKGWVDSLPPKSDPDINYAVVNREVLIMIKDLKSYITNLVTILKHFDAQMKLAWSQQGIETSFNAKCIYDIVSTIYSELNELMRANDKPALEDLEDTNGALQFGFTKDYKLQYIAYSDVADCLCEEDVNMNAYALREGLQNLKGRAPFFNTTINNFIHKLPDINRRYSKYLKGTSGVSSDLFATEQSYLSFVNTYVYPPPETNYDGGGEKTEFEKAWMTTMAVMDEIKNPVYKDLLFTGKYVKDPLQVMSPDVKNMIVGVSNVSYMYQGDDAMMKSLIDE